MDDFNINGFLGNQALSIKYGFADKYTDLFSFAEELNRFAISQVDYFPFQKYKKDLVIGSLFCKCITSYQSTILILSYGLPNEAEVLLRSLMESTFILLACCNEDEYYKDYLKSHDYQRSQFAKNVISNKLSIDLTTSFSKDEIANAKSNYRKSQKYKLNFREIAKKAGLINYYFTQYCYLSLSTHNSPRSIEQYIFFDDKHELYFGITPKMNLDNVKTVIILSSDLILKTLEKIHHYFGPEFIGLEFNRSIRNFHDRLCSLLESS